MLTAITKKKVLPRERKRHTACRVASTRYAALSNGEGGDPRYPLHHPDLVGGYPPPSRPGMGYPPPRPEMGYPPTIQTWDGVPPLRSEMGYSLHLDLGWGTPLPRPWMGYPPYPDLRWGTPPSPRPGMGYPPPRKCED